MQPFRTIDEARRLEALRQYSLDSSPEPAFDDLAALAARICEAPISLISLVDERRQWFKSKIGLSARGLPRDISFCRYTIHQPDIFMVPDAAQDERFAGDPLVTGRAHIRFYAGAPLLTGDGQALGTLCVMDRVPRQLDPSQQESLRALSRQVVAQLELHRRTREVAESEQRLFQALRSCPIALAINRMSDGTFVDVNSVFSHLVGWTREDVSGHTAAELRLVEEGTAAQLRSRLETAGVLYDTETTVRTRGGEIRQVLLSTALVELRDGLHAITTFVDITEQKRTAQRIRQLNRVYSVLSDINQTIVRESNPGTMLSEACRIAVESGQFLMAWIGLRDAPGQPIKIAAHAGATPETLEILHSMFDGEQQGGDCVFTCLALQTARHGICADLAHDPRTASWRNLALQRGYRGMASLPLTTGGKVIGIFNLYAGEPDFFDAREIHLLDELPMDISFALEVYGREAERSRAEQGLRESEERFRQLAENIQEVFWMTANKQVIYVSPAYERIWGRTRASLYASPRSWLEAIHPDDREQVLRAAKTVQTGGEYDETYRIQRPDGAVRWIHDHAFPVRGEQGEIVRIVGTAEDITEQRQLEEQYRQVQKMEAIGQLAGGVAHDFNNLLTVIRGYGSLLLLGAQTPAETAVAAQEIVRAAERAGNLTRQLLAFSRRQVMQPRSLELTETVTSLTTMLQRILGADVHLELVPHPSPLMTHADAGMLDQVLMNLVVNACDAMPNGGRLLIETTEKSFTEEEAAAIPDARPGRYVSLRVTDTGSGISPESLPHIFEPFFTTKQAGKGTGLGLSTVFGIVKQHCGWIRVDSEVGRGTTFQTFLPAAEETVESRAAEIVKREPMDGTETILVVQDEPSLRMLMRAVLEPHGYHVLEAASGVDALRVWEEHQGAVQLLLTDIMMPQGISGLELATRLREYSPHLKVIFTSGYSADIAGGQLRLQEGQNFIQKPSSPQQLLQTVRRCLDTAATRGLT
jgi:PAS domain S-box-containing protein